MHDLGPEIRRAISGNLEEEELIGRRGSEEPMHRVSVNNYQRGKLPGRVRRI